MTNALRIHPDDTVAVALVDLAPGIVVELADHGKLGVVTRQEIPFGHKVAIAPMAQGQTVVKYGASIGVATVDIQPGEHVHVHNLRSVRGAAQS
jgi:hypothetical protein